MTTNCLQRPRRTKLAAAARVIALALVVLAAGVGGAAACGGDEPAPAPRPSASATVGDKAAFKAYRHDMRAIERKLDRTIKRLLSDFPPTTRDEAIAAGPLLTRAADEIEASEADAEDVTPPKRLRAAHAKLLRTFDIVALAVLDMEKMLDDAVHGIAPSQADVRRIDAGLEKADRLDHAWEKAMKREARRLGTSSK